MNKSIAKKNEHMKKGSTHFLRAVVFLMGAAAVFLCALILPAINADWAKEFPEVASWKYPFMALLLATTIPFFIALWQTLKLLNYIDKEKAFSKLSVNALSIIKYCALIFSILYIVSLPIIYYVADQDDAPGLMVIGIIMSFAPLVIAVFAAVLQQLLQSAIDIKRENDLTV